MGDRLPMQSPDVIAALSRRRRNDVFVMVPRETGGYLRRAVVDVVYNPDDDTIDLVTKVWLDGPDEGGPDA